MIQRIQSVYLLLVTVLLVVTLCLPAGEFIGSDGIVAVGSGFGRWWLSVYMGIVRYSFIECDYLIVHYLPIP